MEVEFEQEMDVVIKCSIINWKLLKTSQEWVKDESNFNVDMGICNIDNKVKSKI